MSEMVERVAREMEASDFGMYGTKAFGQEIKPDYRKLARAGAGLSAQA